MALKRIGWENGTLVESAKVLSDGTVQPAQYEGNTPLSAANLTKMEDNTEEFVNEQVGDLSDLNTTDKSSAVGAINELSNIGKFIKLGKTSEQSYSANNSFEVTWQNEILNNTNGILVKNGNRIDCKKGTHIVLVNLSLQMIGSSQNYGYISLNGEHISNLVITGGGSSVVFSCILQISEDDYLSIDSYANNNGNIGKLTEWTSFTVTLLN